MTAELLVAVAAIVVTIVINLVIVGVAFGTTKATITALAARVLALEGEMSALQDLKVTVAEVKTTMGFMLEQFKDLNASIRWMREPAGYEPGEGGAPTSRRRS